MCVYIWMHLHTHMISTHSHTSNRMLARGSSIFEELSLKRCMAQTLLYSAHDTCNA